MKMRIPLIVITSIWLLVIETAAQSKPAIAVSVFAAPQPKAPLQVVGFRRGNVPSNGPEIIIKNTTDKAISGFLLEGVFHAPCSSQRYPRSFATQGSPLSASTPVSAHTTLAVKTHGVDPANFVFAVKHLATALVHVEVGVIEVRFADGEVWRIPSRDRLTMLFTPSLADSDVPRCKSWPTAASELDDVSPNKLVVGRKRHDLPAGKIEKQPGGAVGYFMTCPVKDGVTYCPDYPENAQAPAAGQVSKE